MRPLPFRAEPGAQPHQLTFDSLTRHHDEEFVRNAYQCLLGRTPEPTELASWVALLRSGQLSKNETLVRIRYSSEGRGRNVSVPGMALRRFRVSITRIPVLGHMVRWVQYLLFLPRLARRLNRVENSFFGYANTETRYLDENIGRLEGALESAGNHLTAVQSRIEVDRAADIARDTALADQISVLASEVRQIADRKADQENLSRLDVSVHVLLESIATLEKAARDYGLLPACDPARFDAYYRHFEGRFRGLPETIRARLRFYVPILRATAEQGQGAARFVDLGCGRGEFVQLLSEEKLSTYGVDSSDAMLDSCRESGLSVQKGDVVEHLASLPRDSIAGLTAIHLIEHLPFPRLLVFFIEAFRVLRPGGVGIFETPNPENLIVGACNFYYDPTHMRPLPPDPTKFMLESVGFERVAIERLHAGSALSDVERATGPVERIYSTIMMVPQDYALIAYKPVSDVAIAEKG